MNRYHKREKVSFSILNSHGIKENKQGRSQ